MNKKQTIAVQWLTNKINDLHHDGDFTFSVSVDEYDSILFSATNVYGDLRWFETTSDFYAFIGPRGGIKKYMGNIKI